MSVRKGFLMAHLIEVWKDKKTADSDFAHLGDILVHNQWAARTKSSKPFEFIATEDEKAEMKKFATFSNQDIVYSWIVTKIYGSG
jgi:hypothetical protein